MKRRIGILGGTFDPIHNGHLHVARSARDLLRLDQVVLLPAGDPWQKTSQVQAGPQDRYTMAALAAMGNPGFTVSRIEVDWPGPSFTFVTLTKLRKLLGVDNSASGTAELFFILGQDAAQAIPSWFRYPEVLDLATFVVVDRPTPGFEGNERIENKSADSRVQHLTIPGVDVSSTEVRRRLMHGEPVDDLIQPLVKMYIDRRRLYGRTAG